MKIQTPNQYDFLCPSCGKTVPGILLYRKHGIPIVKCPLCGIGKSCPEKFDPKEYYDTSYFNGNRSDGYSDYLSTRYVLQEHFKRDLRLLNTLGYTKGNLLELGCAYGYFLEVAKEHYSVSGLEICEEAVLDCKTRGLLDVQCGDISKESLGKMSAADIIVMLDVIEHLPEPKTALEAAVSKLNNNGVLLITTGDFASLCAKLMGRHWRLMTPPQHLWFFTPYSLKQMGESLGLELLYIDHPFKKVPLGLIIYQLCRYMSWSPRLPLWMHKVGLPVNLFDAMRIVLRKKNI